MVSLLILLISKIIHIIYLAYIIIISMVGFHIRVCSLIEGINGSGSHLLHVLTTHWMRKALIRHHPPRTFIDGLFILLLNIAHIEILIHRLLFHSSLCHYRHILTLISHRIHWTWRWILRISIGTWCKIHYLNGLLLRLLKEVHITLRLRLRDMLGRKLLVFKSCIIRIWAKYYSIIVLWWSNKILVGRLRWFIVWSNLLHRNWHVLSVQILIRNHLTLIVFVHQMMLVQDLLAHLVTQSVRVYLLNLHYILFYFLKVCVFELSVLIKIRALLAISEHKSGNFFEVEFLVTGEREYFIVV